MKVKLKKIGFFPILIFALIMLLFLFNVKPRYTFTSDTLSKVIQTQSLIENKFQSEELYYPLRDIDPDYNFYPFQGVYHIINKGKHIGQYPVFFSFVSALLVLIGGKLILPFASVLITILTLALLKKYWDVSNFILLFMAFCSYFIIHAINYSEVMLYTFLVFWGMTLFLKADAGKYTVLKALGGGFILGLSVWLRLEGLIFFSGMMLGGLIVEGLGTVLKERRYQAFAAGFLVAAIGFFIFNYVDYGHPLGPRFFTNVGVKEMTVAKRFGIITTLLFGGGYRPGLFGYIPLLFVAVVVALRKSSFQQLTAELKILLITSLAFIVVVAATAPNDGVADWGSRYLIVAILPLAIILDALLKRKSFAESPRFSGKKIGLYVLCFYSLLLTLIGLAIFKAGARQLKQYQTEFNNVQSDVRLFQSEVLVSHIGLDYFNTKVVYARYPKDVTKLVNLLKRDDMRGKRLALFDYGRVKGKHSAKFKEMFADLLWKEENKKEYLKILKENFSFVEKRESKNLDVYIYTIE